MWILRAAPRRPLYRKWRRLPIYQCVWKHREALRPRLFDCAGGAARPGDHRALGRRIRRCDRVRARGADEPGGAGSRDRRTVADADRTGALRRRPSDQRYEAVDPGNRFIAATLETRWNDAMQRLHELEAELAAFEQKTMRAVTAEQKRQILQLAKDFPRLWAASTTKPRDRKRILRLLVRDITVPEGARAENSSDCRSAGKAAKPRPCKSRCRRTGPTSSAIPRHSSLAFESWRWTIMTMKSSPC